MLDGTMSLRPAQALVAESSRFSLRTFFEAKAQAGGGGMPAAISPPHAASAAGGLTAAAAAPCAISPPLPPLSTLPKIATKDHNKFTFNGLVLPASAQNATTSSGVGLGLSTAAIASATATGGVDAIASENLRLKAAAHTLQDKVTQLTQHLATTSESVMRGNKALVAERTQFHAQYAALADKLKDAQVALTDAEAVPNQAIKNEKLLTAKLLELQGENDRLAARADGADALKELEATSTRFHALSARHSVLLDKHERLEAEFEHQGAALKAALEEASVVRARADALHVEAATADALVDALDAKLADVRAADPTNGCGCSSTAVADAPAAAEGEGEEEEEVDDGAEAKTGAAAEAWTIAEREAEVATTTEAPAPVAACCPKTVRCEELQRLADEALGFMDSCCDADAEVAHEKRTHLEDVARRAWASLASGQPEVATAVHLYTDPTQTDAAVAPALELAAHIAPTALQKGANYETSLLGCEVPCCETASEYPNTTEGRTTAFVEAVSRDMKLSMDGSLAAYQNSMKTGEAVRV